MLTLDTPIIVPFFSVVNVSTNLADKQIVLNVTLLSKAGAVLDRRDLTITNGVCTGLQLSDTELVEVVVLNLPNGFDDLLKNIESNSAVEGFAQSVENWSVKNLVLPPGVVT